jgi:hypothetical protein
MPSIVPNKHTTDSRISTANNTRHRTKRPTHITRNRTIHAPNETRYRGTYSPITHPMRRDCNCTRSRSVGCDYNNPATAATATVSNGPSSRRWRWRYCNCAGVSWGDGDGRIVTVGPADLACRTASGGTGPVLPVTDVRVGTAYLLEDFITLAVGILVCVAGLCGDDGSELG